MQLGTGINGYLGKLLNLKAGDLLTYDGDARKVDKIWLFGCPSSSEYIIKNPKKLSSTLDQLSLLKMYHNAHIIYASSEGAKYPDAPGIQGDYNRFKAVIEFYLLSMFSNVTIFRIPRVYGPNKTKGLFSKLDEYINPEDYRTNVEYINEKEFINWIKKEQYKRGIIEYKNKKHEISVYELKILKREKNLEILNRNF